MLDTKNYKVVQSSWQEKRNDLFAAIALCLPPDLKSEAKQSIGALAELGPSLIASSKISKLEFERASHSPGNSTRKQAPSAGCATSRNRRGMGAPDHPLALFTYQTLSQADYDAFFKNYVISTEDWAFKDFGKPNIQRYGAVSKIWMPSLAQCEITEDQFQAKIRTRLEFNKDQFAQADAASQPSGFPPATAWPKEIFVEFTFSKSLRPSKYSFVVRQTPNTNAGSPLV